MADSFTGNINLRKPEVGAAHDTWGGLAGLNGDLDILDAIFLHTGLSTVAPPAGHPLAGVPGVGLRIGAGMALNVEGNLVAAEDATITGTFAITGTLGFIGPGTFSTTSFLHKDYTDPTKVAVLDSSLISTGTARTLQWPDESGVLATRSWVTAALPTNNYAHTYLGSTVNLTYNTWQTCFSITSLGSSAGQVWMVMVNVVCGLDASAAPGTQYYSIRCVNQSGVSIGAQTTITVTGASINECGTICFLTAPPGDISVHVQAFAHSSALQRMIGGGSVVAVRIV